MDDDPTALRLAIEVLFVPWRVRLVREQPLPDGMSLLLNVAAGDEESLKAAVAATQRPLDVVQQAATFFIEQILLFPGADSYRVLGAKQAATGPDLRRNMALLMRWLHPDVARDADRSIFAARIAAAWNTLKTPERRAAYDAEWQAARATSNGAPRRRRHRRRRRSRAPAGLGVRVLAFLLGKSTRH
jgi:hypothetical protein